MMRRDDETNIDIFLYMYRPFHDLGVYGISFQIWFSSWEVFEWDNWWSYHNIRFDGDVREEDGKLIINDQPITIFAEFGKLWWWSWSWGDDEIDNLPSSNISLTIYNLIINNLSHNLPSHNLEKIHLSSLGESLKLIM